MAAARNKRKRRPRRGVLVRRWLGVGALCLVGLLYYRPLHTYVDTRINRRRRRRLLELTTDN